MSTQQLPVSVAAHARAVVVAPTDVESGRTCRTCDAPMVGLSHRTRRCPGCAARTSRKREATALIAGGTVAISLGSALLLRLATRLF